MTLVKVRTQITNYRLLTYTGANNTFGTAQFDINLILNKTLLIKRIAFKWFTLDNSAGVPYLNSTVNFDGAINGHNVLNSNTELIYIPKESGSNINQDGNCTLIFTFNNKPIFLNGRLDDIFIEESNLDLRINEPIQSVAVKVLNAKVCLLNGASLVVSDNIGWKCEIGAYII
ncbi:MAG: hypothetical protein AB1432_11615 [Bacteroidota bacterium]|jgi:hypothetical protein